MLDLDQFILTNARLVLADRVIEHGWLAIDTGEIADLGEGVAPESGLDMAGDTLLPGLIELHTDHLEAHYAPRPSVRWHPLSAVLAYDAQIAAPASPRCSIRSASARRQRSQPVVGKTRRACRRAGHGATAADTVAGEHLHPSALRSRHARRRRAILDDF